MGELAIQFSTTKNSFSWWPPFFPNWASWGIRHLCHSPYSHVDFRLSDGSLLGSSDSPEVPVLSGNPCGVAIRSETYQDFGLRHVTIIKTDKAEMIIALAKRQLGKPFDNSALRGFLSDNPGSRDWRANEKWICSELIAFCLEQSGFFPYKLISAKNRITPADLLLLINPFMTEESIEEFSSYSPRSGK